VYSALMRVSKGAALAALAEPLKPAVPIKRSITTEYPRLSGRRNQMTPDQYCAKWNLPVDHPMVAPNYAA
jgi:predicted transcriptional regulator